MSVRRQSLSRRRVVRVLLGCLLAAGAPSGHALPIGAEVSAGAGAVSQSGGALTIQQTSPRLAINWQSFGIGAGESVVFRQPDAGAIALNRVLGHDPSVILGRLSANGQVFVLNANGVLFGPGAQVEVGGIVVSTLGLADADFLAGRHVFTAGAGAGSVINRGTIRAADGGYVALLGPQVVNEGVIAARLGSVALGAGNQATLTLAGNSLVAFSVDQAAVDALVANKQLIQADGGTVMLSARARDALLATVVNNEGIVEARSVSMQNGVIRLEGGDSGVVSVSGKLDASGASAGESGGSVTVIGDKIALVGEAVIDASGHDGGGTVRLGGDYRGSNAEIANATHTYVGADATIKADATATGDGGRVIVWADEVTQFHGAISARGGPGGGNGGFVETSGKVTLQSTGAVDASAASGHAGQWLLDPNNITIQTAGPDTNVTAGPNFTTTNDSAIVTTGSIVAALSAGTSVTVTTGSAGANTQPGNITVANAIAKTAGGNAALTLTAINNIVFNAGANVSSTSNPLGLALNAGGGIASAANINTNGGSLTFNAAGASTQSGVISGTGALVKNGAGTLTLTGTNTYTGATTVSAGTLQVGNGGTTGTLGTGAVTNNGTLAFNRSNAMTVANAISGTGSLSKAGAGTTTLSGANTYTGATTINAGTIALGASNVLPNASSVVVNGGTLSMTTRSDTVAAVQLLSGSITGTTGVLTSTSAFDVRSGTVSARLGGAVGLNKTTAGTVTLSRANTYTGATTVSAGTLALGANNVLANASRVVVNGGTFSIANRSDTVAAVQLLSGSITGTTGVLTSTSAFDMRSGTVSARLGGAVGLNKTTAGTVTLSGANTYTGTTTISAGRLQYGANNALASGPVVVNDGGTYDLNNFSDTIGALTVNSGITGGTVTTGTGTLTLGGDVTSTGGAANATISGKLALGATRTFTVTNASDGLTVSAVVSGAGFGINKSGAGTLTLSGANTYTRATMINAGVVRAQSNTALGTAAVGVTVVAGAALELLGGIAVGAEALNLNGSGVGGNGALRNAGGNNTWGGTVTLAGATEIQSDAGTLTLSAANAVTGANRNLTFDGAGNGVINGTITTGTGTLSKNGPGTLTLSGTNTYTGATTVNAGTLIATNASALGATANGTTVNSGATLELDGTLTYAEPVALNDATLAWAVGNPTLNGAVALTGNNAIGGAAGTLTLGGVMSGAGGFDKTGVGTVIVSSNNTYAGVTQVSAGALQVSSPNGLGSAAGATSIGSNARLIVDGVAIGGEPITLDGPGLFGAGAITSSGVASLAGPITLTADSVIAPNGGSTLTLAGPVDGAFGLTTAGAGTLNLNGLIGGTTALAFLSTGATGATAINTTLVRTSGSQSYNHPVTIGPGATLLSTGADLVAASPITATGGALTLSAAGHVSFTNTANDFNTVGVTAGGNATLRDANAIVLAASNAGGAFALTANGAVTQSGALNVAGTSTVNAGAGPITLTGANDFGGSVALTTTGAAQLNDVNALALGASSVDTLTAIAGTDITVDANVVATGGGNSIVLAGTTFANNAGAAALNAGAGRWLVWSSDPASDTRGGLAYDFKQYNATYGITAVLGSGNGFLYSLAPSITPTLTGNVSKVYDGTTAATLTAANYVAGGAIDGDSVTLSNPPSGTYDDRNVGTNKNVSVTGVSIASATNGPATVYGYQLASTTASGNVGTIVAAPLAITAATNTKTYDGTRSAAAVPAVTGLQPGDSVTGLAQLYDDRNAGSGKTLSVSAYTVIDGNNGANYSVTTVDDTTGVIHPATLTYVANPAVVLQGAPFPTFTGIVSGFVGGDTPASATTGNLGFATTVPNSSTPGVFPIDGSGLIANFGNYVFVQAPANATALTIQPHVDPLPPVNPIPPVVIPEAYTGALASAAQSESPCAQLQAAAQTETLCGAQQNFRASEQISLVPGWRRVIELGTVPLTVEGGGMRTP